MPTWFLPPDFSFSADGPIQLGTVLAHPTRPTLVLASLGSSDSGIVLPKVNVLTEQNHTHTYSHSHSNSFGIWSKFLEVTSASIKAETGHHTTVNYGNVDHEIRSFIYPLPSETVAAIVNIPKIRRQIDSGMFGKRPVYIVSGLRIAKASFTISKEVGGTFGAEVSGSGPPTGGPVPVEIGGSVSHRSDKTVTDSYDTAPGIVFAYRLHVIRTTRTGPETELFSHSSAFLTGANWPEESLVVVEATRQELDDDLEEQVELTATSLGDDEYCISFQVKA